MLKRFFDSSRPILSPADLVRSITGKTDLQLALPARAIIVFRPGDLRRITSLLSASINEAWESFRLIYNLRDRNAIVVQSSIGGPGIAALVEELAAFGVRQLVLWGYCGALGDNASIGDVILVRNAIREEGVSYHYMQTEERFAASNCADEWTAAALSRGIQSGTVWTCDAIYRETEEKVSRFVSEGVKGVEMEVASFYAVCSYLGIKGMAFLVVSDRVSENGWESGFGRKVFRSGVNRLRDFILEQVIPVPGA